MIKNRETKVPSRVSHLRYWSAMLCGLLMTACGTPQADTTTDTAAAFSIREGDLLFQDSDCGAFCDAIEAVTVGINDWEFSHVGLVMRSDSGTLKVMEAISAGVVLTPLDSFLHRSFDEAQQPKVVVGRLKSEHQSLIPDAIDFIHSKMDAAYDVYFNIENDSFYCSELIHLAFRAANDDQPIFETPRMTFKAPDTDSTFAIWTDYFADLNYPVPEGEVGLNPGSMSRSPYIEIVHQYGTPSTAPTPTQ
ncbi:MAG: YiiX/YebB-like N1pC/P60 family cysteine hydrolase [Bacteroidota bacterium]